MATQFGITHRFSSAADGAGFDADAILANGEIPDAAIPDGPISTRIGAEVAPWALLANPDDAFPTNKLRVATGDSIDGDGTTNQPLAVNFTEHQREVFGVFRGSNAWGKASGTAAMQPYILRANSATAYTSIPTGTFASDYPPGVGWSNRYICVRVPLSQESRLGAWRVRVGGDDGNLGYDRVYDLTGRFTADANYGYYSILIGDQPAATTIHIDEFDPFSIDPNKLEIDFTELNDTPSNIQALKPLRGNATGTAIEQYDPTDLSAGAGGIDEAAGAWEEAFANLGTNWQVDTNAFNIGQNVSYLVTGITSTARFGRVVTADEWRGLAEDSAGQPSGNGNDTISVHMGTDGDLRIGRGAGNVGLFAKSGTAANITIRIVQLVASSGILPGPVDDLVELQPAADVALNAPAAAYAFPATFTELWRYTATAAEKRQFWYNPVFEVGWTPDGGDRPSLELRVRVHQQDGTLASTLLDRNDPYLRNINANLGQIVGVNLSFGADLEANGYLVVEGRAARQTASVGTITQRSATTRIQHAPRGGGGAATGMQQAGATSTGLQNHWFYQDVTDGTTPTFAGVTYNGQRFNGLGAWTATRPQTVAGVLWIVRAFTYPAPGSNDGFGVQGGLVTPEAQTQYATAPPWDDAHTTYAPATDRWIRQYEGSGNWSIWREINPSTAFAYHILAGGIFQPTSRAATQFVNASPLSGRAITDLQVIIRTYEAGGSMLKNAYSSDLLGRDDIEPVDRTDTPTPGMNTHLIYIDATEDVPVGNLLEMPTAVRNFGQGQYGVQGFQFQFQRAAGDTTSFVIDRVALFNPTTWDGTRQVRMDWWILVR